MKTRFYKILYKNKDVVYVGVTTRSVEARFKQHRKSKKLNENYSAVEFDCIEHPEFTTLEIFYKERQKVAQLEKKYIKEELEKGSQLLNLSEGGEWGSQVLEKLRKEEFCKEFGSYDNYKENKKQKDRRKVWFNSWVKHRTESKVKRWMEHWVERRGEKGFKVFLRYWICNGDSNHAKEWLEFWVLNRGQKKSKVWIRSWVQHRSNKRIKVFLRNWINCRTRNKLKVFLGNWVNHRGESKSKVWLRNWVEGKKCL